jgi:hypothetical protein
MSVFVIPGGDTKVISANLTSGVSMTSIVVVKLPRGSMAMHRCSSLIVELLKRSVSLQAVSPDPTFGSTLSKNCSGTLLRGTVDVELTKSSSIRATANQPIVVVV